MQETRVQSLGREDPLKEEMATHSSILTWRILWTQEPGGLQSVGFQKSQTQLKQLSMRAQWALTLCQAELGKRNTESPSLRSLQSRPGGRAIKILLQSRPENPWAVESLDSVAIGSSSSLGFALLF